MTVLKLGGFYVAVRLADFRGGGDATGGFVLGCGSTVYDWHGSRVLFPPGVSLRSPLGTGSGNLRAGTTSVRADTSELKYILSVAYITANLYFICLNACFMFALADAVQICGKFWDTQYNDNLPNRYRMNTVKI